MRIRFSERSVGEQLAEFFRRSECSVAPAGRHALEVNPRLPLLAEAARLEIEGLLRVWCRLHPELAGSVLLVEQAQPASSRSPASSRFAR